MKSFRELISEYLDDNPEEKEKATDANIEKWLEKNFNDFINKFADELTKSLDSKQQEFIDDTYSDLAGFQRRLLETWRAPLNRLDSLIYMCMEIGSEINTEYRLPDKHSPSSRRNVTTRIHARAVQIANEISCLLKGGYADGAMARWRSLHETTVVLAFLGRHDEELSNRFVDFQSVTRLKAANEYNRHHATLGFDAIDQATLIKYQTERSSMKIKYGKAFLNENGWASEVIKKERIKFSDIEEFVKMNHLRPQYGFASKNVHSGIDSIGFKLGLSMSNQDILLAGPSNEGFIEPIQCTSYSLVLATCELIDTAPHDERSIMKGVLWRWHEKLKHEVTEAESALRMRGEKTD